jgi:hypothetical protein
MHESLSQSIGDFRPRREHLAGEFCLPIAESFLVSRAETRGHSVALNRQIVNPAVAANGYLLKLV